MEMAGVDEVQAQLICGAELVVLHIDAGHFHTENPTMPILAEKLAARFPEVTVEFSKNHSDCMKFFV